jgi:hypothetical protein
VQKVATQLPRKSRRFACFQAAHCWAVCRSCASVRTQARSEREAACVLHGDPTNANTTQARDWRRDMLRCAAAKFEVRAIMNESIRGYYTEKMSKLNELLRTRFFLEAPHDDICHLDRP